METKPRKCLWSCCCRQAGEEPPQQSFVNFSCSSVSFVNAQFHLNYCTPIYLVNFSSQEIITLSSLFSKLLLPYCQEIVCFFLVTFHSKKYWRKMCIHVKTNFDFCVYNFLVNIGNCLAIAPNGLQTCSNIHRLQDKYLHWTGWIKGTKS